MARPEITGRRMAPPDVMDDVDAFSVSEFCRRHGISVQAFYKHRDQMPGVFRAGSRVLVAREAAAAWRRAREQVQAAVRVAYEE